MAAFNWNISEKSDQEMHWVMVDNEKSNVEKVDLLSATVVFKFSVITDVGDH